MKLYYGNDYIVRFKGGKLWHFFFKKGHGIYFHQLEKNGVWRNDTELITNIHENFSLSIDNQDMIHLICQGHNGEIIYMKYNGKTWDKQLLSHYDPSQYTIQFPSIIALNGRIHILFTVGTSPSTGIWSIYHYYWNGNNWIDGEITRYKAGRQASPFYFDFDQKNLHIIYRSLNPHQYQILHCRFDNSHNRWSRPENLTHSLTDCNMPSILIKDSKLHLSWTSVQNSNLQVRYRSWNLTPYSKASSEKETLLSNEDSNCSYPHLLWAGGQLWCIWYQNNDLYCCSSPDEGITWTPVKAIGWSHIEYCYCIKYCSNHPEDQLKFKVHRIFANLEHELEFPIIGEYIDLPKPVSVPQKKVSEPEQEILTPPLQQAENAPSGSSSPESAPPEPAAPKSTDSGPATQESAPSDPQAQGSAPLNPSYTTTMIGTTNPSAQESMLTNPPAIHNISSTPSVTESIPSHPPAADSPDFSESADLRDTNSNNNTNVDTATEATTTVDAGGTMEDTDPSMQSCDKPAEKEEKKQKEEEKQPDKSSSDHIITYIQALLDEMDKIDGLKTKLQSLLSKAHSGEGSAPYIFKLERLLNSWIQKAQDIQAQNQSIMRQIEELRRRSIENQRQWEILLEEFEEIKAVLEKNFRKGLLKRILS